MSGRKGDFRLLQVVVRAGKHEVGDAEAEDAVGLFKQIFCEGIFVVQRLAHSNELGALARKNVGVHTIFYRFGFKRGKSRRSLERGKPVRDSMACSLRAKVRSGIRSALRI